MHIALKVALKFDYLYGKFSRQLYILVQAQDVNIDEDIEPSAPSKTAANQSDALP